MDGGFFVSFVAEAPPGVTARADEEAEEKLLIVGSFWSFGEDKSSRPITDDEEDLLVVVRGVNDNDVDIGSRRNDLSRCGRFASTVEEELLSSESVNKRRRRFIR